MISCAWVRTDGKAATTISTTGISGAHRRGTRGADSAGFTLVEFILVMGLLATVMAMAAPSLARFFRQRVLEQEAARFVALTEFARSQAISKGMPMVVWLDPEQQRFGVEPQAGYPAVESDLRSYPTHPDVDLSVLEAQYLPDGTLDAALFLPDGSLDSTSLGALYLVDRFGHQRVVQTTNGYDYVVLTEEDDDGWQFTER